jgi:hypothetical protein
VKKQHYYDRAQRGSLTVDHVDRRVCFVPYATDLPQFEALPEADVDDVPRCVDGDKRWERPWGAICTSEENRVVIVSITGIPDVYVTHVCSLESKLHVRQQIQLATKALDLDILHILGRDFDTWRLVHSFTD